MSLSAPLFGQGSYLTAILPSPHGRSGGTWPTLAPRARHRPSRHTGEMLPRAPFSGDPGIGANVLPDSSYPLPLRTLQSLLTMSVPRTAVSHKDGHDNSERCQHDMLRSRGRQSREKPPPGVPNTAADGQPCAGTRCSCLG